MDDPSLWDAAAETYAAQDQIDWFDEFLERHLGDVGGKRVLDLGCGHGWFAGQLHARDADVVGVDGSERLLDIARANHPDVEFRHADLTAGIEGTFDAVVALMVLMDLHDLSRVRPRLAPGGVLVATILHPSFYLQRTVDEAGGGGYRMVRNYLDCETWWIEGFGGHNHYHRPLGHYVEWIASLGLGVVEVFEPPAHVYEGWRNRIPTRLGLAARAIADAGDAHGS